MGWRQTGHRQIEQIRIADVEGSEGMPLLSVIRAAAVDLWFRVFFSGVSDAGGGRFHFMIYIFFKDASRRTLPEKLSAWRPCGSAARSGKRNKKKGKKKPENVYRYDDVMI